MRNGAVRVLANRTEVLANVALQLAACWSPDWTEEQVRARLFQLAETANGGLAFARAALRKLDRES